MSREDWAYVFTCEQSIEAMRVALNDAGPWQWQLRDSDLYGDYLNVRPAEGVRIHEVSIHVGPACWAWRGGYRAQLELPPGGAELDNAAARAEIDRIFRGLLGTIGAGNIKAIEPYD